MVEGSHLNDEQKKLFSAMVDYIYTTDILMLQKSQGEGSLLYRYLTSDHYKSLTNITTISKLSGRYYLNDKFNWNNFPNDKFIIKLNPLSWMKTKCYQTRYYCIPVKYITHFIDGLYRYLNSMEYQRAYPDIEHCFYYHSIIKEDEVYSPDTVGVSGRITWSGELVSD